MQSSVLLPLPMLLTSKMHPTLVKTKKRVCAMGENPLEPLPIFPSSSLHYPSGYLGAVPTPIPSLSTAVKELRAVIDETATENVDDIAVVSPLQLAERFEKTFGANLWLKREDLQPTVSFISLAGAILSRPRGVCDDESRPREKLLRGVLTCSTGNHGLGVALAAKKLGCRHNVVVGLPLETRKNKIDNIKTLGADVWRFNKMDYEYGDRLLRMSAENEDSTYVPAFDHEHVIAGQGTVGFEILEQMASLPHAIFVPVGGGGLIAGIANHVKSKFPEVKIIGVEPYDSNKLALSLHYGQRVQLDKVGSYTDAIAIKTVGKLPFLLCQELIDGVILVRNEDILSAINAMFDTHRSFLEPAGALALAGATQFAKYYDCKGKGDLVAITSGGNFEDFDSRRLRAVFEKSLSLP
ncbi:hypothetical protein RHMOL_Rhmol10G0050200 [Rhododendron molle]|uniref:Uncharacterized protein n=1 Tax=Rhododendron molle TaxID=49168 RepID=A0ACC0M024_RHOML|nr:hypothetical protein RHMOL_Rhmol10G0050200 [Rhododendron molle]